MVRKAKEQLKVADYLGFNVRRFKLGLLKPTSLSSGLEFSEVSREVRYVTSGIVAWLWGTFFTIAMLVAVVLLIIAGKSVK